MRVFIFEHSRSSLASGFYSLFYFSLICQSRQLAKHLCSGKSIAFTIEERMHTQKPSKIREVITTQNAPHPHFESIELF